MEKNKKRYLDCKYLDAGMDGMLCSMDICTTCKEFNGENCSCFEPKENMNETEIEEMAKVIKNTWLVDLEGNTFCVNEFLDEVDIENVARELYEQDYRNCKDKVVFTEREHEIAMKNQYDVGFRFGCKKMQEENGQLRLENNDLEAENDKLKEELAQVRKETAREIVKSLKNIAYQSNDWSHGVHPMVVEIDYIEEIAEDYGVEDNEDER